VLWMALQSSEVLTIGPISNGINFQDKMMRIGCSMQPGGDLENAWMMSNHVKWIKGWTTMAAHMYDGTYQRVMTIACCDFQSEDNDAQVFFSLNLNHVMARHGIPHATFISSMADSVQANWNIVRIVYGSGDPKVPMEGHECTCYFHWK
jgi:hypothetical protein